MFELKPIHSEAIPKAIEKAVRYRLLNEPREAESICRDVLRTDPDNQEALACLVLALTDQFGKESGVDITQAQEVLPKLAAAYDQAYYTGVVLERWGKASLGKGAPSYAAHEWMRQAMTWYEKAEAIRPPDNDDVVLRWNACARMIDGEAGARRKLAETAPDHGFNDEVPMV